MKRRNFLKYTMGAMGSAMGIAAAKADVLQGVSQELPKPAEPTSFGPCDATHGTVSKFKGVDDEMLQMLVDAKKTLDENDEIFRRGLIDTNNPPHDHIIQLLTPFEVEEGHIINFHDGTNEKFLVKKVLKNNDFLVELLNG